MFINILVCENNSEHIKHLQRLLTELSVQVDCDVKVYWLYAEFSTDKIQQVAIDIHLALVSLDIENAPELGSWLYAANPDCLLLYYKNGTQDLEPLLSSRPIAFQNNLAGEQQLRQKILALWQEIWSKKESFHCQSKTLQCHLPYNQILYFESDLKHVLIHISSGKVLRLYRKLDEIEAEVNPRVFLRTHQSYLVNRTHISFIEKPARALVLSNGERVFISKNLYEQTLQKMNPAFEINKADQHFYLSSEIIL